VYVVPRCISPDARLVLGADGCTARRRTYLVLGYRCRDSPTIFTLHPTLLGLSRRERRKSETKKRLSPSYDHTRLAKTNTLILFLSTHPHRPPLLVRTTQNRTQPTTNQASLTQPALIQNSRTSIRTYHIPAAVVVPMPVLAAAPIPAPMPSEAGSSLTPASTVSALTTPLAVHHSMIIRLLCNLRANPICIPIALVLGIATALAVRTSDSVFTSLVSVLVRKQSP
jgi:hypothetical protein